MRIILVGDLVSIFFFSKKKTTFGQNSNITRLFENVKVFKVVSIFFIIFYSIPNKKIESIKNLFPKTLIFNVNY